MCRQCSDVSGNMNATNGILKKPAAGGPENYDAARRCDAMAWRCNKSPWCETLQLHGVMRASAAPRHVFRGMMHCGATQWRGCIDGMHMHVLGVLGKQNGAMRAGAAPRHVLRGMMHCGATQ